MTEKRIFKISIFFEIFVYALIFIGYWFVYDSLFFKEILSAKIVGSIYFFIGVIIYKIGISGEDKLFLRVVLGGTLIRLLLTVILIILCIKILYLRQNNFIFPFFIFYIYHLIFEIAFLVKKEVKITI